MTTLNTKIRTSPISQTSNGVKKYIFIFGLIIFVLSFGVALAQEDSRNIQIDLSGLEQYLTPIEIKDININADLGNNLISGSFILKNRSLKPLPEVGYTVRLKKAPRKVGIVEDAAGAPLFDFQSSSKDFFYYQSQEERKFNFSLGYPDSIESGTYQIVINSHDKIMNFFGSTFQEIELEGENQLIYLDPQKCAIRVHNLDFYLNEGPPVEPNSQVPVICEITNPAPKTQTLIPEIEVAELMVTDFANSAFYKKDILPSFIFQPNETKNITFTLTAPRESLTYNTVLTLFDENKNPVSNKLSLRYVVKGEGARIAKVNLDKTYYSKGETAKVDIEYYASSELHWLPENTLGGRFSDPNISSFQANIQVKLVGTAGLNSAREITCGEFQKSTPEVKTALGTTEDRIEIPIARDCYNPQIKVNIGENNKNYSQYQLTFRTNLKDIPPKGLSFYLYLVFGFIVLVIVYLFMKTRFKTNPFSLFVVFIFAGSFMLLEAQTAQAGCGYNNSRVGDGVNFSIVRGMGRVRHGDCAHMVNNIMIQSVSVAGNTIIGAVNLTSVDYASGDQNVGEHVALTYYIKDSQGNFVRSPNTENSFLGISSTEDPADGGAGSQYILPFSINISGLSPGAYTVYLDVRPGLRHKSFNDLNPRMINGYIANVYGSPSGNWGIGSNYYAFGVSGDWLQFLNNNKIQTFVDPFCTSMYQGFGNCPKGQLKPPCAAGRNQYCYGFNTAWYYIPPVVRSFNINIVANPTLSFSADPSSINTGQSSTLNWSSQNTTSCLASAIPSSREWTGFKELSGNQQVTPPTTTVYTLSCSGPGGSVSKSATVTVVNQPPSASIGCTSPAPNCTGYTPLDPVTLLNQSSDPDNNITSCAWSITGPQSQTLNACSSFTPQGLQPGSYNARLIVTDAYGLSSTANKAFSMKQDVIAKFSCSEDNLTYTEDCSSLDPTPNSQFWLKDLSTPSQGGNINSWNWTFTNANPSFSSLQNLFTRFSTAGTQTVVLQVTDSQGRTDSETKTVNTRTFIPKFKEVAP